MVTTFTNGKVYNTSTKSFEKQDFSIHNEKFIKSSELPYKTIDLSNLYITPGFIDCCSQIGLYEIGIRWEGDDSFEFESNINYSVIDGIYSFDKAFKKSLSYGITTSHVLPSPKSLIGAHTAVIHHAGNSVEQMIIKNNVGFCFSIGHNAKSTFYDYTKKPLTRMGIAQKLKITLKELKGEFGNNLNKILIRAHQAVDIELIERLANEYNFEFNIVYGTEIPLINESISSTVVAGPTFQYIASNEMMNLSPKLYKYLYDHNIDFVFCTDHPTSSSNNLLIEGNLAVREGVPRNEVLANLTSKAAEFLGVGNLIGSIKEDYLADFVIWNKHPLDLDAQVIVTYVKGEKVFGQNEVDVIC